MLSFFGFSVMSATEAFTPIPSLSVISFWSASSRSARAPLLGSFGMATDAPSFSSDRALIFFE
ncbi:hypothetical protein D3C87_1637890 [compost metagenome]